MIRALAVLITLLIAFAAFAASEHQAQNAGLPLVHADYQRCVTVATPPLAKPRGIPITGRAFISEVS